MSLRDWFAGQALTGNQLWDAIINERHTPYAKEGGLAVLAATAYAIADAMLKERAK